MILTLTLISQAALLRERLHLLQESPPPLPSGASPPAKSLAGISAGFAQSNDPEEEASFALNVAQLKSEVDPERGAAEAEFDPLATEGSLAAVGADTEELGEYDAR